MILHLHHESKQARRDFCGLLVLLQCAQLCDYALFAEGWQVVKRPFADQFFKDSLGAEASSSRKLGYRFEAHMGISSIPCSFLLQGDLPLLRTGHFL